MAAMPTHSLTRPTPRSPVVATRTGKPTGGALTTLLPRPGGAQDPAGPPGIVSTQHPEPPEVTHPTTPLGTSGAPSSLDPEEKSEQPGSSPSLPLQYSAPYERFSIEDPTPLEDLWHHSGWAHRRHLVHAALIRANLPWRRIGRFERCGSGAWIYYSRSRHEYQVRANYCHDRHCARCSRARATRIAAALAHLCINKRVRFITLTIRSSNLPLADQLRRLRLCFRELRRRHAWRARVTAGCVFTELTYNAATATWHPHLHVLCTGKYFPQPLLVQEWRAVTGDSYIVDVRETRNSLDVVNYVVKYTTKSITHHVWSDPNLATEYIKALRGCHMAQPFGAWHASDLDDHPDDVLTDWICVGRLNSLLPAACQGDPDALRPILFLARHHDCSSFPALAHYLRPDQPQARAHLRLQSAAS